MNPGGHLSMGQKPLLVQHSAVSFFGLHTFILQECFKKSALRTFVEEHAVSPHFSISSQQMDVSLAPHVRPKHKMSSGFVFKLVLLGHLKELHLPSSEQQSLKGVSTHVLSLQRIVAAPGRCFHLSGQAIVVHLPSSPQHVILSMTVHGVPAHFSWVARGFKVQPLGHV
jgi:hypothetical protein